MDLEESRMEEGPRQQWRLKPSPKKGGDSFSLDDSLESKDSSSSSNRQSTTPKKVGILRMPDTPGTGQSVRFGRRMYDDGDESRMSNSTTNNSDAAKSPKHTAEPQEQSEDSVDMSLGFIRSSRQHTLADPGEDSSDFDREEEEEPEDFDNPTLRSILALGNDQSDARFEETFALPNLEGYSNLDDISLDYGDRTGNDRPLGDSSDADVSFNESFLQAEIEMAKRHMQEEEGRRETALAVSEQERESEQAEQPSYEPPVNAATVEHFEEFEQFKKGTTPHGANTTQASEYMSTRSQASSKSPASSAPDWMTPISQRTSPGSQGSVLKLPTEKADLTSEVDEPSSSSIARPSDDSPSVQRVNRRVSLHGAGNSPSISLARLQNLTNLPSKRSPLGEESRALSPEGSSSSTALSDTESRGQESDARKHDSSHSSLSSLQLSSNTIETGDILKSAIHGASELDSIHMERADKLILWAQEAEEQSRIDRCMLVEERARAERAQKEAEMATISLQVMREEEEKVQERRREKVQGLEELVARLYRQLDEQLNNDTQGAKDDSEDDNKIQELETRLRSQDEELIELRAIKAKSETESEALKDEQAEWLQEKQDLERSLEKLHEDWARRTKEKEDAYRALESEFDSWREKQYQPDEVVEEERKMLSKKLQLLQEEQQDLTSSLSKAEEQAAALREEVAYLKDQLADTLEEVNSARRGLEEKTSKCDVLQETAAENEKAIEAEREAQRNILQERLEEVASLQRKVEQMEEENDSLLQSMAELEDYRRTMEEDFLTKRDAALQESKEREEGAISLAEEMQSRLEKLEDKMEKMTTRTTMLEHEVGDRGLQIAKLEKAKERLEEDNLNYSIALSSKQQELNLLKRNGGRSVRNTPISTSASGVKASGTSSRRLSALALRQPTVAFASSRGPLSEIQAADESGSSLPPLQSGPVNVKTMRRKTMDVDLSTPRQRARVPPAREDSELAHGTTAMPPPSSRVSISQQRSSEEDTKVNGPPSHSSSSTFSVQTSDTAVSAPSASYTGDQQGRTASSRRSSTSSNRTIQAKAALSASIVASEGPMDISELQVESLPGAARMRRRLELQSRELEAPRHAPAPPLSRPVTSGAVTSGVPA